MLRIEPVNQYNQQNLYSIINEVHPILGVILPQKSRIEMVTCS